MFIQLIHRWRSTVKPCQEFIVLLVIVVASFGECVVSTAPLSNTVGAMGWSGVVVVWGGGGEVNGVSPTPHPKIFKVFHWKNWTSSTGRKFYLQNISRGFLEYFHSTENFPYHGFGENYGDWIFQPFSKIFPK